MKVAIEPKDKHTVELNLEIPSDRAQQEYNKACRRIGQRVNIPGFRRGKAPFKLIEKTVGQDRIRQEALERMLPMVFADAISENQLDIVAPPRVQDYQFDLTNGVNVKAIVELRPEVTLPELLKLDVTVQEFKLPDNAEQAELDAIVSRHTSLEVVEGREATNKDVVTIDFDGRIDGEALPGGSAKGYQLDLEHSTFIDGFAEQLVGHSVGENFDIKVTFPESYHEESLAGKEAQFAIKLHEIRERVAPELNDDLAKKVGSFDTLDELKAEIKKGLEDRVSRENEARKQKALIETFVNTIELDLPESMINREASILVQEARERFQAQGLKWEDFVQAQGADEIQKNLKSEAVNRIKTSLAFGALAKQENIKLSDEEFEQQVSDLADARDTDPKSLMRELSNNPSAIQSLTDRLLAVKVVEFLTEKANFTMTDEPIAEPEKPEVTADVVDEPLPEKETAPEVVATEEESAPQTEEAPAS